MEERLKALEGITYSEWVRLKILIDEKFEDIKNQNTFTCDKNVLDSLTHLNKFIQPLIARK